MKKRPCRFRCDLCRVNFESFDRFSAHFTSRAHLIQKLQTAQQEVQLFADEISTDNLCLCDDENGLLVPDHLFDQEFLNVDDEMLDNESSFDDSDSYLDEFISGVSDDSSSDGDIDNVSRRPRQQEQDSYFPFPSEIFFLLYSYVHNISRPKTRADLDFLWLIFNKLGVNVPSLNSVLNFKIEGVEEMLQPQKAYYNSNPYYWLRPSDFVQMQLATPSKAETFVRYPEKTDAYVYEMPQGLKWFENEHFQSSSISMEGMPYYVNDIVEYTLNGNTYQGKLIKFYTKVIHNKSEMMIKIQYLHREGNSNYCICPDVIVTALSSSIKQKINVDPLQIKHKYRNEQTVEVSEQEAAEYLEPHIDSVRTGGNKPTTTLPLLIFSDETSGNTTKKWNRLESYSMSMASLPRKEFRKLENIHFLTTSNVVPSVPLGKSIASDLQELEDGKIMYDAYFNSEILVKCPVMCTTADNPRASEFEHHLGSCANKFCRKCNATSDNGNEIQILRNDECVQQQIQEIEECTSEAQKKKTRSEHGVTEKGGAFDTLKCFSGNNKTPIEILHTILLGPVKYLLSSTIKSLNQHEKDQLHAKISALDMSAFAANIRGNITRNYGSYVGRDFKLWMQVAVFVLQGIIPDENLLIWELLSEIFSFAYATGFDRRNQQAANQMVTTFVNAVRTTYPELVKKPKIHLLLHLVDDIMNLGPANGFCTERFEAFNSTIRSLNINSNRHASSLDICTKIAKMERLRFVLSGGRWGEDHSLQASQLVRNLGGDPKIQHFLNNTPAKESMDNKAIYQSGCLRKGSYNKGKLQSQPVNQCLSLEEIAAAGIDNTEESCIVFKAVVSENHTLISSDTPIVYVDSQHQHHLGIFKKGLKMEVSEKKMVQIEKVQFCKDNSQQPILGCFQCPVVKRTGNLTLIQSDHVIDQICLMHDCSNGGCTFTESETRTMVEREAVTKVKFTFVHNLNHKNYLVNKFYLGESLKYFNIA